MLQVKWKPQVWCAGRHTTRTNRPSETQGDRWSQRFAPPYLFCRRPSLTKRVGRNHMLTSCVPLCPRRTDTLSGFRLATPHPVCLLWLIPCIDCGCLLNCLSAACPGILPVFWNFISVSLFFYSLPCLLAPYSRVNLGVMTWHLHEAKSITTVRSAGEKTSGA